MKYPALTDRLIHIHSSMSVLSLPCPHSQIHWALTCVRPQQFHLAAQACESHSLVCIWSSGWRKQHHALIWCLRGSHDHKMVEPLGSKWAEHPWRWEIQSQIWDLKARAEGKELLFSFGECILRDYIRGWDGNKIHFCVLHPEQLDGGLGICLLCICVW